MRRALRVLGLLALLSMIVWAATGVGWWLPDTGAPGDLWRGFVLMMLHVAAMLGAAFSYLPENEA